MTMESRILNNYKYEKITNYIDCGDVCYDIMSTIGDGTMCLYKHIPEHQIE